ncbi:nacht nucleoside triphosphatase [Xylaria palmicola]|nr:nacht nucleoside triphosphatase [Xylaria palmicola]
MDPNNASQGVIFSALMTIFVLLAGSVIAYLSRPPSVLRGRAPPARRNIRLEQLNPDKSEADTDVDIIAIHGLDTQSADTWKDKNTGFNWLYDLCLGQDRLDRVRIFTCDWPAALFQPTNLVQKTTLEYARLLFEGIQQVRPPANTTRGRDRPILFIASCLGGVILIKALVDADKEQSRYSHLRRATRGIVFLATPFRGTSFEEVATWAEPALKTWASLQGTRVDRLVDNVKGPTFDHSDLVGKFTRLCQDKNGSCHIVTFYETGTTSLPSKPFPWLPRYLRQEKQLVDASSATLDIIEPISLARPHVLMNKFRNDKCPDYQTVARNIRCVLGKIRTGTPLKQADNWIQSRHYTPDRLKVERLSGQGLAMDQCYINLSIVQTSVGNVGFYRKEEDRAVNQPSPFSLQKRLQIDTPDKDKLVELSTLFSPRTMRNKETIHPRRILIRGRAGVGKTTLCKKIVFEFARGTWPEWHKLFDRVLWIPLRNLKLEERRQPGYDFRQLFLHEYFSYSNDKENLAKAIVDALEDRKTLFLLDGLDEVSQDLSGDGALPNLLRELIKQPNTIITTRPYPNPPSDINLELETIGFNPTQVLDYLQTNSSKTANQIKTFLQQRPLLQGLVRIPIQLDALCFVWNQEEENLSSEIKFDTMTDIYRAIENALWKKDTIRLSKRKDGTRLEPGQIRSATRLQLENFVQNEIKFLERLAFAGLHNEMIEFEKNLVENAFGDLPLLFDETIPNLSFLRSSDPRSERTQRSCYFIHLTYQEYFAARYFVRQLKANEPLQYGNKNTDIIATNLFFQQHKYTARYDILWRFVTGLLDVEGKAEDFFNWIKDEPRDLLGPTHQRLVMHCLSEVSPEMKARKGLEEQLLKWLIFEYKFTHQFELTQESELPPEVLNNWFQLESEETQLRFIQWLSENRSAKAPSDEILQAIAARLEDQNKHVRRIAIQVLGNQLGNQQAPSDEILQAIAAHLEDQDRDVRRIAIQVLGNQLRNQQAPSDEILQAIAAYLKDQDRYIRRIAIEVLGNQLRNQQAPSDKILQAITARLEDQNKDVKCAAIEVLGNQQAPSDKILQTIAARLEDQDRDVRSVAIQVLGDQQAPSDEILQAIAARLEDQDGDVRSVAIQVLGNQQAPSDEILQGITAYLEDQDGNVRSAAIEVLGNQQAPSDEILQAIAARLEDQDGDVRSVAIEVLGNQQAPSDEILQAIAARLEDQYGYVRSIAIEVLGNQQAPSDEILQAIAARLEDQNRDVRRIAIQVLRNQQAPSDEILQTIAARLEDQDGDIRSVAIEVLGDQQAPSDEILQAIAARLEDQYGYVRYMAIQVLGNQLRNQQAPSDEILQAIAARLEDQDGDVRSIAIEVLGNQLRNQQAPSNEILQAIAARLEDRDWNVRNALVDMLISWRVLYSITNQHIKSLFNILLQRSFREHVSWHIVDKKLILNLGLNEYLENHQAQFIDAILSTQTSFDMPRKDIEPN